MDKSKQAIDAVIAINQLKSGETDAAKAIALVCDYYDAIKADPLSQADLKFLKFLASAVGMPHYFDLLGALGNSTDIEDIDLKTFSATLYESSLHTDDKYKVHKYQKDILSKFILGEKNRFFLSASTSFGKTHLMYEIIHKMAYKNIILIFPTVALLSENLERLISDHRFQNYTIHTLSDAKEISETNIFVFTPERFLSFVEKQGQVIKFDFAFVDEIYKIDSEYIIDDQAKEDERDISYRIAVFYALLKNADALLAGPYIESYNESFRRFLQDNDFTILDYNNFEIVSKSFHDIKTKKKEIVDESLSFEFTSINKIQRIIDVIRAVLEAKENCIIYCARQSDAERYAAKMLESPVATEKTEMFDDFLNHLHKEFGDNWVVCRALKAGIGVHHASIPKYIQKEIISLFNEGIINTLFSTTTITEGVNTSAKNVIVTNNKKGEKTLRRFDAKNISGRAGRFLYHYKGRVIVIQNDFINSLNEADDEIRHKNYDANSPKNEVDIFYTHDEFLTDTEQKTKANVLDLQELRGIPEEIFDQYKVVSRSDKITVYDKIKSLSVQDRANLKLLSLSVSSRLQIDWKGFQTVLDVVRPIVSNETMRDLIDRKCKDGNSPYSIILPPLTNYLDEGLRGLIDYHLKSNDIDDAIRKSTKFVYTTLRYQIVKYLGVFNIIYKYIVSQEDGVSMDEVLGIDKLLMKLEYNALTDRGKIASDYGVPANVLRYYEATNNGNSIRLDFDSYENTVFDRLQKIMVSTDKS